MNAAALNAKAGGCDTYLLKGGVRAWRAAGLPVERP
jgi:rhodanese-related sulfurtransferase